MVGHVSDTALWVAALRAHESARADALFRDPLARVVAGARGVEIARQLPGGFASAWMLSVRTVVIDEMIRSALRDPELDTVINLAAGLDTRPYRMDLPSNLHWVEVDLPALLAYKQEKLQDEQPRCRLTRIATDLSDETARRELFARLASDCRRALVLTEGLLIYLTKANVDGLSVELHAHRPFHYWVQDFFTPLMFRFMNLRVGHALKRGDAAFRFATEKGEAYFQKFGWTPRETRYLFEEATRLRRGMYRHLWWKAFVRLLPPRQRRTVRTMAGFTLLER